MKKEIISNKYALLTASVCLLSLAGAPAQTSFVEEFNSPTLDPAWTVYAYTGTRHGDGPANHYSLTDHPGSLRYYVDPMTYEEVYTSDRQPHYWYYYYDPALMLLRPFQGSNWVVEAKLNYYLPNSNSRSFDLFVYFGAGGAAPTYRFGAGVGRDLAPAGMGLSLNRFQDGTGTNLVTFIDADGPAVDSNTRYFRLQRNGTTLTTSWSMDGTNWNSGFSRDVPEIADLAQNIVIGGGCWFNPVGSYGDWDYVKLSQIPTASLSMYAGLTLVGMPGSVCRIDAAEVLGSATNWTTLTNITLPSSPYLWFDTDSAGKRNRFYRTSLVQ